MLVSQSPTGPAVNAVHPTGLKTAPTGHCACPPCSRAPLDITKVRGTVTHRYRPGREQFQIVFILSYFTFTSFLPVFLFYMGRVKQAESSYNLAWKAGARVEICSKVILRSKSLHVEFLLKFINQLDNTLCTDGCIRNAKK